MTVKELATELAIIISEGHGDAVVQVEELDNGYIGELDSVDVFLLWPRKLVTLMGTPDPD